MQLISKASQKMQATQGGLVWAFKWTLCCYPRATSMILVLFLIKFCIRLQHRLNLLSQTWIFFNPAPTLSLVNLSNAHPFYSDNTSMEEFTALAVLSSTDPALMKNPSTRSDFLLLLLLGLVICKWDCMQDDGSEWNCGDPRSRFYQMRFGRCGLSGYIFCSEF